MKASYFIVEENIMMRSLREVVKLVCKEVN